jgi:hypothetical protein
LQLRKTLAKVTLENSGSGPNAVANEEADRWFLDAWYRLIEHYVTCQFTFGRDKLATIAGVVDDVQRRTGLSSFTGLWRELLPMNYYGLSMLKSQVLDQQGIVRRLSAGLASMILWYLCMKHITSTGR